MKREAIQEYVESSRSILEASPQMNEANTKAAILRDFLELLDWEIPSNTQLEYPVKAFGQTYNVDYALILEGAPVAFLEAKGADTSLTPDHDEQLSSYMMNKNVNYGILANGKRYWFFQRKVDASNVSVKRVGDVSLESLSGRLAVVSAFTKDAIETGEAGKILGRINELREARSRLKDEKDALAAELTNVLTDSVSDVVSTYAESQSKELIDRLIQDIESEIDSEGSAGPPDGGGGDTVIEPRENAVVGKIRRAEIKGDNESRVAVFPTRESGLPFLMENNAWGFVRVGSEFDYVAMYVTGDVREVRYIATVKDVVPPDEARLVRPPEEYFDRAKIADDKMVVRFQPDSLYELKDPVPYKTKYPQSLQYTTLGALREAETTDDML